MDILEYLKINRNIEFTKQQQEVIYHKDNPALVLAVPGAGKSTSLLARTANLVLNQGISADTIV